MSSENVAPPRRPTLLVVRPADGADTAASISKAVGDLAKVVTVAWLGAPDAASLSAVISERLSGHDIVLFAEGALAGAALAVTAPEVRAVIAVEPPGDADPVRRPVDVVLATPGAPAPTFAARPGVRLHRASPGASLYAEDVERLVAEVAREACRRAAPNAAPGAGVTDGVLLEATPLVSGTVGYLGPEGDAFAAAYVARRPDATVSLLSDETPPPLDVLVLGGPIELDGLAVLLANLKPGGWLVARGYAADAVPAGLAEALTAAGFGAPQPVDHGGSAVFRARRGDAAPARPLLLAYSAISPWMMDIRTRLPVRQMASDPDLALRYFTPLRSIPPAPLDQPKIVVMQRPSRTSAEDWRLIVSRFIAQGWLCVMEYDDHPLLVAEVAGLAPDQALFARLGYVHAVQTSVEPLADLFAPYNPEVAVFPNAAFELLPFPERSSGRRIFYGATPRGDLPTAVARSLAAAIARFPDMDFVVVGSRAVFDALPTSRKVFHGYMAYESYLDLMATCDVSLAPIDEDPMYEAKSDAKFVDASRAGLLTIASPTIYRRTIRHGENGLIADTLDDWPRLLAEPDVARRMARRAWEEVRDGRMFCHQITARKAWYRSLWDRREALNDALMERLPGLREEVARLLGR